MFHANQQVAFAPAHGIQELSFDEVNEVAGGPLPAAAVLVIKAVVYSSAAAAGVAAGAAAVKAVHEAVT